MHPCYSLACVPTKIQHPAKISRKMAFLALTSIRWLSSSARKVSSGVINPHSLRLCYPKRCQALGTRLGAPTTTPFLPRNSSTITITKGNSSITPRHINAKMSSPITVQSHRKPSYPASPARSPDVSSELNTCSLRRFPSNNLCPRDCSPLCFPHA